MKAKSTVARSAAAPRAVRRSQKERSSQTQQRLMNAAIELVHEFGFARLTIADVAQRAGLTTGAIQHHYTSRQALIRGLVGVLYPVLNIGVDHLAASGSSVAQRLERLVDVYWSIYRKPEYLVFWELVFGTREEHEFRDYLRSLQKEIVIGAVADFGRLFSDIKLQPRQARELFVFLTCQLRGLAFVSLFEDAKALDADVVLLKEAVHQLVHRWRNGERGT